MERQEFEIHSYQRPSASGRYYKVFYTDGTSEVFPPYTYPRFAAHVTKRCKSLNELKRSYPKAKYISLAAGGLFFDTFNSKSEAKKHAYDGDVIKAIDDTGKVVDLSDEEQKFFYPQRKQKAKEIKLKQPKITNKMLTKMSRGV